MTVDKSIVLTNDADGGIDIHPCRKQLIRKLGSITIADDIRAPLLSQLQGQLFIPGLSRHRKRTIIIQIRHSAQNL